MGMFDYVNIPEEESIRCPSCDTKLTGWQSKAGDCCLDVIDYWHLSSFNNYCNNCGLKVRMEKAKGGEYLGGYKMLAARTFKIGEVKVGDNILPKLKSVPFPECETFTVDGL